MTNELIGTILARRSIRSYKVTPVAPADVETLLEAGMAAPSASNLKPWHFVIVTERETLDALAEAHPYAKMLFEAPLCIAVCGAPSTSERYWIQDCSAASENILLAATALGLGSVWLGVHPREDRVAAVRQILHIPDGIVPLNLLAIGYAKEGKEPRTQYDAQRVHHEQW